MKRPALALAVVVASCIVPLSASAAPLAGGPLRQPKPVTIHLELNPAMIQQAAAALQSVLTPVTPPAPPPQETPPSNNSNSEKPGLVDLPVAGYGPSVVSVPSALTPKPVLVVAHGHNGNPFWSCDHWRNQIGERGFILCPRGPRIPGKETFTHGKELPQEIDAGLVALKARYGARVDPGPMIYAGYSQGAGLAYSVMMKSPARFPRGIIIEGGAGGWNAKKFKAEGGQRMLFACGQAGCANAAKPTVASFEKAGVPSKVRYAEGAGHIETGPVGNAIKEEWAWLVTGDPRWAP